MYCLNELFSDNDVLPKRRGGWRDSTLLKIFHNAKKLGETKGPEKAIVLICLFYLSRHETQSNHRAMSIITPEQVYSAKYAKTQEGAASKFTKTQEGAAPTRTGSPILTQ